MPLNAGDRLGPYEIIAPLGAGGMGEVYRARDTRLDRSVAVKILTDPIAASPEVKARFEREARMVSSLNHPNICILFDVGSENGVDFLVMELLEGETLAARLERGPLPPAELLKFAIQIADALDKAHRQGLMHRDLKPANIMLSKGVAKLLDFGLARPTAMATSQSGLSQSPTMSRGLTAEGTIVGTYQYMAPEQLEGVEADQRSDLWALGATLYEMATGKRAFDGRTQASLISAIMKDQPRPVSELQPVTPPGLDRVIQQCLAKDPEERIQTAHDVKLQLQWIAEGGSQAGVPAPVAARRRGHERTLLGVAALATLAAVGSVAWILTHRPPTPAPLRFRFSPPSSVQFVDAPRVSPDGQTVAFSATDSTGETRIWLRAMDALDSAPLAGTEGTGRPFWSPDSRYLGFFAGGKLKKVRVSGGPPIMICDAASGADGSWGASDIILFDGQSDDPIRSVSAGGGVAVTAMAADTSRGERTAAWPDILPDGKHFLYLGVGEKSTLRLGRIGSKDSRELFACDSRVQYSPPGYLVFSRGGTLVAQPFDAGSGKVTGEPVPVAEQVVTNAVGGADFSISKNGVLVYATRGGQRGQLVRLDRQGHVTAVLTSASDILHPMLSPDGKRIALRIRDEQSLKRDIGVVDLARNVSSRLTFEPQNENYPVWSPDGDSILYYSDDKAAPGLFVRRSTGAGRGEKILASTDELVATDWSRDGRYVVYYFIATGSREDIWVLPMFGDRKPFKLLGEPFGEVHGRISPDGRWIAYSSDETGRSEVYVQSFPETGGKWQVSTRGGSDPVWRGDGKELFYLATDQHLMTMPVSQAATFEVVSPEALFSMRVLTPSGPRNHYAVTADGQTFYTVAPLEGEAVSTTTVVVNWPQELKKK